MSSLSASGVPRAMVGNVWADLWPLIQPAYDKSDEKTDILAGIYAQKLTLWGVWSKNRACAGIVTKLLLCEDKQPSEKHCHLWLVGGSRLLEWAPDFLSKLIPWAKSEGCNAVTGNGRPGWQRIVPKFGGYRVEDRNGQPCWRLDV